MAFLKSCDGSYGWLALLQSIVADMIRAGANGEWKDGRGKVNGVVIGFMSVISRAAAFGVVLADGETPWAVR